MSDPDQYPSYKLIIIGDSSTGKTSIINRYLFGKFDPMVQATVGVSNLHSVVKLNKDTAVDLKIWDTAGQEQYSALIPMFSRDSDVCILVSDFSRPETIDHIDQWVDRLHKSGENPPLIVAVNKIDLDGVKPKELILMELKQKYQNILFVSAVSGHNICELFLTAAQVAHENKDVKFNKPRINSSKEGGNECC